MSELKDTINRYGSEHGQVAKSVEEVALGFIRVANEAMSRPIRSLTQMKVCEQHVNCQLPNQSQTASMHVVESIRLIETRWMPSCKIAFGFSRFQSASIWLVPYFMELCWRQNRADSLEDI